MSDTYEINESNQVVPYTSGRKCTDTRAWRDATDLELQQQEQIEQLQRELAEMTKQRDHYKTACDQYSEDETLNMLAEIRKQRDTLVEAMTEYMDHLMRYGFVTAVENHKVEQALAAVKGGNHE